jgi:uncharacterized protein (DUF1501 family)
MTQNRRDFLKLGSAGALGVTLSGGWLSAMAQAAGGNATDYKALVCVFLAGGNDACGTVFPPLTDPDSWVRYNAVRDTSKSLENQIRADTNWPTMEGSAGKTYPIHRELKGLAALQKAGKLAMVANVGNLARKTTRSTLQDGTKDLYRLRSHNDQTNVWLHGTDTSAQNGWGGKAIAQSRSMDLPGQTNQTQAQIQNFRAISINANNSFGNGPSQGTATVTAFGLTASPQRDETVQNLDPNDKDKIVRYYRAGGLIRLLPGIDVPFPGVSKDAVKALITGQARVQRTNLIERDYAKVVQRAVNSVDFMDGHWAGLNFEQQVNVTQDGPLITNELMDQLYTVMRVIKANQAKRVAGRQVFYVSLGGFDLHDSINKQGDLLKQVNDALVRFDTVMGDGMKDVVLFTASEFGRLLHPNGNGTDHAWGGHHFVLTGQGNLAQQFAGQVPSYAMTVPGQYDDPQMMNDGAMIPSVSLVSYADELLKWFGVPASVVQGVIPGYRSSSLGLFV